MIKRVAAIHDISGLGRCSLSVALPVLSAQGIQCCPIPTAMLSSQTDGYRDYSFYDLTEALPDFIMRWKNGGEKFDAIYTGFLGCAKQVGIVKDFIDNFKSDNTLLLVDPVMGDNGSVYESIDETHCDGIRELVRSADIITPNLTEAAILLGEKVPPDDPEVFTQWPAKLLELGPRAAVITGIDNHDGRVCVAACDGGKPELIYTARTARDYPGTGDMFSSVLLGNLLRGATIADSARLAAEFVTECAALTYKINSPAREGLVFEPMLHKLLIR